VTLLSLLALEIMPQHCRPVVREDTPWTVAFDCSDSFNVNHYVPDKVQDLQITEIMVMRVDAKVVKMGYDKKTLRNLFQSAWAHTVRNSASYGSHLPFAGFKSLVSLSARDLTACLCGLCPLFMVCSFYDVTNT
jgi:hypothetical protein